MMDYSRIKEIVKAHHLEMSYPLYDAMKQAAGEAAQAMRGKYLDAIHALNLPDELITYLNRRTGHGRMADEICGRELDDDLSLLDVVERNRYRNAECDRRQNYNAAYQYLRRDSKRESP